MLGERRFAARRSGVNGGRESSVAEVATKDVTALTDVEHELRLGIKSGSLVYVGCWSHGAL
jgi:hypothetical protein